MADQFEINDDEQDDDFTPGIRSQYRGNTGNRSQGGNRSQNGGGGFNRKNQFRSRRKVCAFCTDKTRTIDWKDVNGLRRFVDDNGSIRARRKTGTCAKHQRRLAVAVKRARHIALLPFTGEHVRLARKN